MKLAKIFEDGHTVALTRGPVRYVVCCPNLQSEPGWWPIAGDALEAVVYRRKVGPEDLTGVLSETDRLSDTWLPDEDHCWCPACASTRKMLETHGDD